MSEEVAQGILLDDPAFLKEIVERVLQEELLEGEMTGHISAAPRRPLLALNKLLVYAPGQRSAGSRRKGLSPGPRTERKWRSSRVRMSWVEYLSASTTFEASASPRSRSS